jgi:predicted ATP-grasp superfamily ATP-dependent carboligase
MQEQLEEQIVVLQTRVKKLAGSRDQLIRDQGAAERKLEEAQEKLHELGIETEGLTSKQLQEQAEALEAQLASKVAEITSKVEDGEQLVAKYQTVRLA